MARYFFHLRDGSDLLLDTEGTLLDGHAAIVARTLLEARHLLSGEVLAGALNLDQWIDVQDEKDLVVHRLCLADAIEITFAERRGA